MSLSRYSLLTACCSLWLAAPALPAIYRWVDDAGHIHFGDRPPPAAETRQLYGLETGALPESTHEPPAERLVAPAIDPYPDADTVTLSGRPATLAPWPLDPPCNLALSAVIVGETAGFTPIAATASTDSARQAFQSLLQAMSGRWRGATTEITCLGGSADAQAKLTYYAVTAHGTWHDRPGRWSLLSRGDASAGASDKFFAHYLQPGDYLYYYDFTGYDEPPDRNANDLAVEGNRVQVLESGPNEVAFYVKRRVGNVASGELRRFLLVGDSLDISELFFTAGNLSGYRYWQLVRR